MINKEKPESKVQWKGISIRKEATKCSRTRWLGAFEGDEWHEEAKNIFNNFLITKSRLFIWAFKRMANTERLYLSSEEIDDLVTERMLKYFVRYHYFQPYKLNRRLLFKIARNDIRNFKRKRTRRSKKAKRITSNPTVNYNIESPEDQYIKTEFEDEISSRLKFIEGNDYPILSDRLFNKSTYRNIGLRMDLHPSIVRSRAIKMTASLKNELQKVYSRNDIKELVSARDYNTTVNPMDSFDADGVEITNRFPTWP